MAALEDLEARVSALEANQREHGLRLNSLETRMERLETTVDDHRQETRDFRRSMEDQLAEIKDLIVGR